MTPHYFRHSLGLFYLVPAELIKVFDKRVTELEDKIPFKSDNWNKTLNKFNKDFSCYCRNDIDSIKVFVEHKYTKPPHHEQILR